MSAKPPAHPTVHLGSLEVAEEFRMGQLEALKADVETWAKKNEVWHDAGWHVPHKQKGYKPEGADILHLWAEGGLIQLVENSGEHERQFMDLLERHGFYFEAIDHVSYSMIPTDDRLIEEFLRVRRWQWVRELAQKRLYDIHSEVFEHFAKFPETLASLHWRQYEEFLDAVFRNQGYRTALGSGGNDGGVDIRLYQSEAMPELVTLVQAKRYRDTPIKQDAVASLFGTMVEQRANKGIFATTSRFQPKAKAFAKSIEGRIDLPNIELADNSKVGEWCSHIAKELNKFFAGEPGTAPPIVNRPATELTGKIVVAGRGYTIVAKAFAVIEADFPNEVILRSIGSEHVSGDGQRGTEVPAPSKPRIDWRDERFVAFKKLDEQGRYSFWNGENLFFLWDGTPEYFDHCD